MFGAAALITGEPLPAPTPSALGAWAYLVIFGSVVAFTAYVIALRSLPTRIVTTYSYVNPILAVVLGWIILGERITLWTVAGAALVLIGVTGVFRAHAHEMRAKQPPKTTLTGHDSGV